MPLDVLGHTRVTLTTNTKGETAMKTLVRTTAIALAMGGLAFGAAAQETTDQTSASNAQAGQQMQASFCERPWATIDGNDDGFVAPNEASGAIDTHFSQIDANGNGEITKTEYVDCLSRMSGQTAAESDRDEQSFSSLDLNGDNQVNLEEFRDSAQKAFETAQSDNANSDAVLVLRRFVWLMPEEAKDESSLKDMTTDEARAVGTDLQCARPEQRWHPRYAGMVGALPDPEQKQGMGRRKIR